MRILLRIWAVAGLAVALLLAGCLSTKPDPPTSAEREALHERYAAEAQAAEAQANAERDIKLAEIRVQQTEADADAYLRRTQAETSLRIQEMHEQVTEDLRRLAMERDNFVMAVNDHQATMVNQGFLLQQQIHMMESIDYNAQAAAENSWFANIGVIMLAVAILGLIALVVVLFARVERRLTSGA